MCVDYSFRCLWLYVHTGRIFHIKYAHILSRIYDYLILCCFINDQLLRAAHIPDDGSVLIVYGPHVGVATTGGVGKVERRGIRLVDNCCGSAIAASNYLKGITDGGAPITTKIQSFTDFQQGAVQELILPHGKRLAEAEDRMRELPFCLYDSQDLLMSDIVKKGASKVKNNIALLGGIQINTSPESLDYFLPLRFDYLNNNAELLEDMLDDITYDF